MSEHTVGKIYLYNIYLMGLLLLGGIIVSVTCFIPGDSRQILNGIIYLIIMGMSFVLAVTKADNHGDSKDDGKWLYRIIIVLYYASALLFAMEVIPQFKGAEHLVKVIYAVVLILTTLEMYLFAMYILEDGKLKAGRIFRTIFNIASVIQIALVIINFFIPVVFVVDSGLNIVYSKPQFHSAIEFSWVILSMVVAVISKFNWREKIAWLTYMVLYLVGWVLDVASTGLGLGGTIDSILTLSGAIAILVLFCNVYIRRSKEFMEKQKQLMRSELTTMQMQINPHFIYNTLGSIGALYHSDPIEAESLLHKFADYLRDNHAHIHEQTMIPFLDELKRMEHYMAIEQVRFPDIEVEYDFQTTDFEIPISTIQPLVENAVLHGICAKMDRVGLITIRTREKDDCFTVQIEDDGVGFDKIPENGKRQHIGMKNAKTRLELICGGTLEVRSQPGKGTICEIKIPKEVRDYESTMR